MAEVLTKYKFRNSRYPWDKWFDGQIWRLDQGKDFTNDPSQFRTTVYQAARRMDLEVSTAVEDGALVLQSRATKDS